jgi:hypothetical protein
MQRELCLSIARQLWGLDRVDELMTFRQLNRQCCDSANQVLGLMLWDKVTPVRTFLNIATCMNCGVVSAAAMSMSSICKHNDSYAVFCKDSLKCRIASMMAIYKYEMTYSEEHGIGTLFNQTQQQQDILVSVRRSSGLIDSGWLITGRYAYYKREQLKLEVTKSINNLVNNKWCSLSELSPINGWTTDGITVRFVVTLPTSFAYHKLQPIDDAVIAYARRYGLILQRSSLAWVPIEPCELG